MPPRQVLGDRDQILGETLEVVVAIRRPGAFTVSAQIQRHRAPAVLGEPLSRRRPGMPGLPSAVRQYDRSTAPIAHDVRGQMQIIVDDESGDGSVHLQYSFSVA